MDIDVLLCKISALVSLLSSLERKVRPKSKQLFCCSVLVWSAAVVVFFYLLRY